MADIPLAVIPPSNDLVSEADRALARELAAEIEGDVRFGRHDRMLYATDASIYQVEPLGVAVPKTLADLRTIVEFAARHRLPLLARGGGTSLAGQCVSRALLIDTSKYLRTILDIDETTMTCRVEPGVVLDQLNAATAKYGLRFGPDVATSSHATLGGMIGNNSAGAHSLVYGRTVEHLESLKVILADGAPCAFSSGPIDGRARDLAKGVASIVAPLRDEIRARFPKTRRRVNGYNFDLILDQMERSGSETLDQVNLSHLVCGSEGTLAVVEEATLRLVEAPKRRGLMIIAFSSVDEALSTLSMILDTGPSAVEMLDDVVIAMARGNSEYRQYVDLLPRAHSGSTEAVMYVEYFAGAEPELAHKLDSLARLMLPHVCARHTKPAAMAQAWKLRKAGEPLLHGVPGARKPITFIEDTAVDPAKLAAFVREFRAIVTKHGTTAAYYAHASVGCLHIRPLVDPHDPRDHGTMVAIAQEVTDLVKRYGGALSGEHGDGRVRSPFLERFYGKPLCDGFARMKQLFDPEARLNPGNIVSAPDPQRMLDSLRVKPERVILRVPHIDTFFRYDHGFEDAVEQCNGAGVCRKMAGGTMCPSYRATLDERHATRGRGNALRLAITGQLVPRPDQAGGRVSGANWNDLETLATLDLCLSCKACESECPSNVDIAKLKAEYHGQRFRALGRVPMRTRLIGNVRAINRFASGIHPIANALASFTPTANIIRKIMNIDRRRSLPRFGPSLRRWMAKKRRIQQRTTNDEPRTPPGVIFFPDCFTTYSEPHIGRAAVETLEAIGYSVIIPRDVGCCGRSLISVGMMEHAQRTIARTGSALLRAVEEHNAIAVVCVEPSCISAIKDEWLEMNAVTGAERQEGFADPLRTALQGLALKTYLVEEFLDRFWTTHPRAPAIVDRQSSTHNPKLLLHAHCHQKALWGSDTSANLLRRICGAESVQVLDTGCCGMAGSFGYPPHRYDLSMKIGEQALFSAIRNGVGTSSSECGSIVVAPGTSCRHQIFDGTGAKARHPIEIARDALHNGSGSGVT